MPRLATGGIHSDPGLLIRAAASKRITPLSFLEPQRSSEDYDGVSGGASVVGRIHHGYDEKSTYDRR
jgi:hypothetical protein